jgi:hypothetical protein
MSARPVENARDFMFIYYLLFIIYYLLMCSLDEELTWSALDFSVEPAVNRTFRATFPSEQSANEFRDIFAEGKVPFTTHRTH